MGNQVRPRRGTSRSNRSSRRGKDQSGRPRPRKVEMVTLHAEAHCGVGKERRGLRSLFRIGLVALLLLAPLFLVATGTIGYATTLDPPPDSPYWNQNAPQADGDPQRSGAGSFRLLDERPELRWQTDGFAPFLAGPVMDEDNVYVVDRKGVVAALNLTTGDEAWRTDLKQEVRATPAMAYGWLYVATEAKELHALSAQSGTVIHKVKLDGAARAPPLVADGRVFVGNEAGTMQVFDATTLDNLWSFKTSTVAYANDTVGTEDAKLLKPVRAGPAAYDGKVYVGAWNGRAYAFSTHGNVEGHPAQMYWSRTMTDIVHAAPTVDRHQGLVLYALADGRLQALHRDTGTHAWWVDAGGSFMNGPAVNKTRVVAATTEGRLLGIQPSNGAVVWERYDPSGYIAAPILLDDAVVALSANGTLTLLSGADGKTLRAADGTPHVFRLHESTHATPAVTKNGIVVVDQGGTVTLIGPKPQLTADLVASLARTGNLSAGAPVSLTARVTNTGPDLAPDVTGTLSVDGNVTQTLELGRLNNTQTHLWNLTLEGLGPGTHKMVLTFTTSTATDPDPADAIAILSILVKDPAEGNSGGVDIPTKSDGTPDLDAIYGRDIDGDDTERQRPQTFLDGVRAAWSLWMIPAGVFFVAGGIVLGRYVQGRAAKVA